MRAQIHLRTTRCPVGIVAYSEQRRTRALPPMQHWTTDYRGNALRRQKHGNMSIKSPLRRGEANGIPTNSPRTTPALFRQVRGCHHRDSSRYFGWRCASCAAGTTAGRFARGLEEQSRIAGRVWQVDREAPARDSASAAARPEPSLALVAGIDGLLCRVSQLR